MYETERLILRKISPIDENSLFRLDSDPLVHQYLGNSPVTEMHQIKDVIELITKQYENLGIGRYAVLLKETNEFIGWAGLKMYTEKLNGHQHFYDLGYRFIPAFWGKGYATEASLAWIDIARSQFKAKDVFAMVDSKNMASKKVLEKCGLIYQNSFEFDEIMHLWYRKPLI